MPPAFPIGPCPSEHDIEPGRRYELIEELARTPDLFAGAVSDLSTEELDTRYVNWTIRQIVHHVADSHLNCLVRFKWALTEDHPTIKAYDETAWAQLPDARADVSQGLALQSAVHAKWDTLLRALDDTDFARRFRHPESGADVRLDEILPMYTWHARHHASQILWLRERFR